MSWVVKLVKLPKETAVTEFSCWNPKTHCSELIINVELIEAFTELKQDKRNPLVWTPCFSENKFILFPCDPLPTLSATRCSPFPFPQTGVERDHFWCSVRKTRRQGRWAQRHLGMGKGGATREPSLVVKGAFLLPSPGPLFDRDFPYMHWLRNYWAMQQLQRMPPKGSQMERDTGRSWLHVIFKKVNNDMGLWLTI